MDRIKIQISELNNQVVNNKDEFITTCESNYKMQMEKIVASVEMDEEIKFIRLAGPSSSGKTTTANLLKQGFEDKGYNAKVISLDDFFVDREKTPLWENGEPNYETVDSIDWKLFDECVHNLIEKGESKMPTYNFITGKGSLDKTLTLHEKDIIIIEGLHSLNPVMDNFIRSSLCLKVYLEPGIRYKEDDDTLITSVQMRFFRRLIRDAYTRGTSPENTLKDWDKVLRGEKLYIDPYKDSANFTINTAHPYEICIYKFIANELKLQENEIFKEILKPLEKIEQLDKKYCPKTSLLQEFVH